MDKNIYRLVLASSSPRRQELIKYLYLPFEVKVVPTDEISQVEPFQAKVADLAQQKSKAVLDQWEGEQRPLIVAADTIVVLEQRILGKPRDRDEAREMLRSLSGGTHHVYTGVALLSQDKSQAFYEKSSVTFERITEDLMELYLDTHESMDKAGAYGIQAYALSFIKELEGSYSNVVGFPINKVLEELKRFLGAQDDDQGLWRQLFV